MFIFYNNIYQYIPLFILITISLSVSSFLIVIDSATKQVSYKTSVSTDDSVVRRLTI